MDVNIKESGIFLMGMKRKRRKKFSLPGKSRDSLSSSNQKQGENRKRFPNGDRNYGV